MSDKMPWYDRVAHAWNAFNNKDPGVINWDNGPLIPAGGYGGNPGHRRKLPYNIDRTTINSIYNRMATDVALSVFEHIHTDDNGRYTDTINSKLNDLLSFEANIDQTGRSFMQDVVMSMLSEGVVAAVPIETSIDPNTGNAFEIDTIRTGKIDAWYTDSVRIDVYNERTGLHEFVTMSKRAVAIIENPFYSVMNEPNSTLKRLSRRLTLLDVAAERSTSGKLDLILQMAYGTKTDMQKARAEARLENITDQLQKSEYGIAYADATERITQLNRPVENNTLSQIEYLTKTLHAELGITEEVLNGTASEAVMQNYYKRTIEPILNAIIDEFERKFLSKTARARKQAIRAYRDQFSLTTPTTLAEVADKFTRNEILSSNEIRDIIGYKPSQDSKADELRNSNLNHPEAETGAEVVDSQQSSMEVEVNPMDQLASVLNKLE